MMGVIITDKYYNPYVTIVYTPHTNEIVTYENLSDRDKEALVGQGCEIIGTWATSGTNWEYREHHVSQFIEKRKLDKDIKRVYVQGTDYRTVQKLK